MQEPLPVHSDGVKSQFRQNPLDYDYLVHLRRHHPAWRLLLADNAPMIMGFFHYAFIQPNRRTIGEQQIIVHLDDYLFHLRGRLGEEAYPRTAQEYLNDWSEDARGWLRRYYVEDTDQPHYDLTPAAEIALQWLAGLERRQFIGAESRLKLVFDLLREIAHGSETDPDTRIAQLQRQRDLIDAEIERVQAGQATIMDPAEIRERFVQAVDTAYALLGDFRQVEQNFRDLDRQIREKMATWEGGKGDVLADILGSQDAIVDSDQGRSFNSFWDFLMSADGQEELPRLMEQVMALEPVAALQPDPDVRRVHRHWLTAGEATLRTQARLSEQLRRYLDDQAWLENRRIMDLLRDVEQHALALRDRPPTGPFMTIAATAPAIELPMDRPLYRPPVKPVIQQHVLAAGTAEGSVEPLFQQIYIDYDLLRARLRQQLRRHSQVTLQQLVDRYPLEHGLAELVAWLNLATTEAQGVIDEERNETVVWTDDQGRRRRATLPLVIFVAPTRPAAAATDEPPL